MQKWYTYMLIDDTQRVSTASASQYTRPAPCWSSWAVEAPTCNQQSQLSPVSSDPGKYRGYIVVNLPWGLSRPEMVQQNDLQNQQGRDAKKQSNKDQTQGALSRDFITFY